MLSQSFFPLNSRSTSIGIDISLAVSNRNITRAFGVEGPEIIPSEKWNCNCDFISFYPHLQGTHIESISHLRSYNGEVTTLSRLAQLPPILLTTILPCDYDPNTGEINLQLRNDNTFIDETEAVVIWTGWLQDMTSKYKNQEVLDLDSKPNPFLSCGDISRILIKYPHIKVLMIDSLSIDSHDDVDMQAHKLVFESKTDSRMIVELCNIPPTLDASIPYALFLNAAAIDSDAIPCRPVLYPLT